MLRRKPTYALLGATLVFLLAVPILFTSLSSTPETTRLSMALDSESFWGAIETSHEPWLVEFFDPRCSSCQRFEPVWRRLIALRWANGMRHAAVSIEARPNMELARRLGVIDQGLPNVQLFVPSRGKIEGGSEAPSRPTQHLVMHGGEDAMTAVALKERVLEILHVEQLKELAISKRGGVGGPDDPGGDAEDAARDADDLGDR